MLNRYLYHTIIFFIFYYPSYVVVLHPLLYYTPFTTKVVQQFFAGTCVYYVYKGSYHQVSNSKYITIYLALPFSYVTLHFVVPEKLGFLVSMLFDAKLTLTILASDPVLPLSYKGIYILLYQCPNLS